MVNSKFWVQDINVAHFLEEVAKVKNFLRLIHLYEITKNLTGTLVSWIFNNIWVVHTWMLLPAETCRLLFTRFLKKRPQNIQDHEPILLRPIAPELKGQRRPTWLALIFHFFSPNFVHGFMVSALWPISLWVPKPYLSITFLVFMISPWTLGFYSRVGSN